MARREFTRKIKQAALTRASGRCDKCKAALKSREGEVDHILPDILGGEPVLANAQVLCRVCHDEKTAEDIRRTRKADRSRDKASGAIRPKQSIKSAPKAAKPAPKPMPPRRPLFSSSRLWKPLIQEQDHD